MDGLLNRPAGEDESHRSQSETKLTEKLLSRWRSTREPGAASLQADASQRNPEGFGPNRVLLGPEGHHSLSQRPMDCLFQGPPSSKTNIPPDP